MTAPERMLAAVEALGRRGLVVFPADGAYALGADALDAAAAERARDALALPAGEPVPVAVADLAMLEQVARTGPLARDAAGRLLPGPLLLLLRPDPGVPDALLGADGALAVGIPAHPAARELAARFGPVTCAPAAPPGRAPPRACAEALALGGVAAWLDAGPVAPGLPTILDLTTGHPRVARPGAFPPTELEPWRSTRTSTMTSP